VAITVNTGEYVNIMKKYYLLVLLVSFLVMAFACSYEEDVVEPEPVATEALDFVKGMGFGVNIGNTFDSLNTGNVAGETGWGNPRVSREFIVSLKNHGFKNVRVPVSWIDYLGPAPDYTITENWMTRIQEVTDWILNEDMYCIINLHHDGGGEINDQGQINAKYWIKQISLPEKEEEITNRFIKVWEQIAENFRDYSDLLIFEAYNEVGFDQLWNRYGNQNSPEQIAGKAEAYRLLNKLNRIFVDTVRATEGNNAERYLLIPGYWTDIACSLDAQFVIPVEDTVENRQILSIHFYDPFQFSHGPIYTWGAPWEINSVRNRLNSLQVFINRGIPVINGEYAVSHRANSSSSGTPKEPESRQYWMLFVTQHCIDMGIAPILWDTGYRNNNYGMGDVRRQAPYDISPALQYVFDNLVYPGN